jgi:hypothetical protein
MGKPIKFAAGHRLTLNPLWVDVIRGAGCALDPNPAPAARHWHGTAIQAFDKNFRALIISRETAVQKISRHWGSSLKKASSVGQAARENEAA